MDYNGHNDCDTLWEDIDDYSSEEEGWQDTL